MSWPSLFIFGIGLLFLQACSTKMPLETQAIYPIPQNNYSYTAEETLVSNDVLIVIDPGHGGEDYGANSKNSPKYYEKNLNLSLARMLNNILNHQGYNTLLTRKDDLFITLDKRASIANNMDAALFISLHFNSAPSEEASGIEIFYYRSDKEPKRTQESSRLAGLILDQLIKTSDAKSRGIKHGNLAVIRQTTMPAVLVEAGFLTNETEMERIKDPAYLKKIALGIALGIKGYLDSEKKIENKDRPRRESNARPVA